VHALIETTDKVFVMTGSSAKKLKHGGANLLAGRAFVYSLFPLSFLELGEDFTLQNALQYGTLPKLFHLSSHSDYEQFLRAYAQVYLREEIWVEQLVRKLNPFRKFLEVAAQCNGKVLNIANISRDVGVDDKTIISYFTILEETLIGFYLEPFHHSFRKRLAKKPKFYFFDPGVVRALSLQLTLPLQAGTSAYGEVFEHLVICECFRLKHYFKPDFKLSFLQTTGGVEVDLIIERPGQTTLLIEIKSTAQVQEAHLKQARSVVTELENSEAICLSNDGQKRVMNGVTVYPWQEGLRAIFGTNDRQ
jgi:predicted AAA+ superfamily ATPase